MVTERFKELTITSLASVEVLEEIIPEETKADALKEIITLANHLAIRWDRVWTLAEKRLEVIEVVDRIVQSRDKEP
jgi:benzoyl-CoA reductase/2-hydroxyglutaryl-CoA dehydratase subunit BcrC/BadD/HgdB